MKNIFIICCQFTFWIDQYFIQNFQIHSKIFFLIQLDQLYLENFDIFFHFYQMFATWFKKYDDSCLIFDLFHYFWKFFYFEKFVFIGENLLVILLILRFTQDKWFKFHYSSTKDKNHFKKANLLYSHSIFLRQKLHKLFISEIIISICLSLIAWKLLFLEGFQLIQLVYHYFSLSFNNY